MQRWVIIGALAAGGAALLWTGNESADPAPRVTRPAPEPAPFVASPLPGLGGITQPPPTDAPVIAAHTGRPTTVAPPLNTDTGSGSAAPTPAPILGSIRMAQDPQAQGASGEGFVPLGGDVPPAPIAPVPTIDYADPEELAFKKAAGDLANPIDPEEQIKRNAYGDGQIGIGNTASEALSPSALEHHVNGAVADAADRPESANETHRDGKRLERPIAGLSPTEANTVPVPDLTRTVLANSTAPASTDGHDTLRTDPVPSWDGPGTLTEPPAGR